MRKKIEWFKDAIIYQVMVDRFAGVKDVQNSFKPTFIGGNLKALTKKIPYFKKLGINTILLSPIMQGTQYHGYHITDYFSVNSHFGTIKDFEKFIYEAHKENIKIIMDIVPNHVSNKHPFFIEAKQNKNSKYRNWFYFKRNNKYLSFLDYKELPKLNLDNKECAEYMIKATQFWLNKGVDGLRLDHLAGPSITFWKQFAKKINKSHPHVVLLGEMWTQGWQFKHWKTLRGARHKIPRLFFKKSNESFIKDYVGIIDGCLDFTSNTILRKYATKQLTKSQVKKELQKHYQKFPKDFLLPTFLDNHDMDRILAIAKQDKNICKELIQIQFNIHQPPIIYYGSECAMTQNKLFKDVGSYADVLARQPMQWTKPDKDVFSTYIQNIKKRKKEKKKFE